MLRALLIALALPATSAAQAATLVGGYVVERGDGSRVKHAPGAPAGAASVDIVFGIGRASARGFVAAAGRAGDAVTVARGPRTAPAFCPKPAVSLP
jgi:hypothetical protein